MWAHKEGRQPEHKAIEHGEIRRTLSEAIADHELMFEHERFSYDLARSARAEEFREDHEQMDRQGKQIAHELETILPANLHKTAPQRRFMPNLPIRHPQGRKTRLDAPGGQREPSPTAARWREARRTENAGAGATPMQRALRSSPNANRP